MTTEITTDIDLWEALAKTVGAPVRCLSHEDDGTPHTAIIRLGDCDVLADRCDGWAGPRGRPGIERIDRYADRVSEFEALPLLADLRCPHGNPVGCAECKAGYEARRRRWAEGLAARA